MLSLPLNLGPLLISIILLVGVGSLADKTKVYVRCRQQQGKGEFIFDRNIRNWKRTQECLKKTIYYKTPKLKLTFDGLKYVGKSARIYFKDDNCSVPSGVDLDVRYKKDYLSYIASNYFDGNIFPTDFSLYRYDGESYEECVVTKLEE